MFLARMRALSRLSIARFDLRQYTTKVKSSELVEDLDQPIKFTTSEANKWMAQYSRKGVKEVEPRLWYEPYVIVASIAVFMIYFCILREENDIDLELSKSLYDRIDGLEERDLLNLLAYNTKHGLDTKEIIDRLNEIRQLKK